MKHKNTFTLSGLAAILHMSACPFHGIAGILIKTGVISGAIAAPLYSFHEKAVDLTSNGVHYFLSSEKQAHEVAHAIGDYGGWGALGVSAVSLGYGLYSRRKRKEVVHSS